MQDDSYIGDIATRLKIETDTAHIQHIQKLDDVGKQVKDERTYGCLLYTSPSPRD